MSAARWTSLGERGGNNLAEEVTKGNEMFAVNYVHGRKEGRKEKMDGGSCGIDVVAGIQSLWHSFLRSFALLSP